VAEMHGELMEFNENLQKQLLARDALVRRMQQELTDLRGPVSII
jgi:sorting nexin-29